MPDANLGGQSWRRPPGFRRDIEPSKDLQILGSYLGEITKARIPVVFLGLFIALCGVGVRGVWGLVIILAGIAVSIGQAWLFYYRHPESPRAHGRGD